ncbi:pyruvate dehydrogenase (acetyl-transferring) kinase isozyme 2, mitochondrial-like [Anneissia japonica]|uniref:pyruvate dehydrogenase (acetyl-transferring) kinase isozyme 2, mitochondrial-like n=1 Tax=Anneissia japonica TaxID=1529436 RepID=UPI001425AA63|nr:pyruvate dehydrogenase (acetyl-transferring) kinase isozyme 2, mitochondrial-like [Anneissia japonica]
MKLTLFLCNSLKGLPARMDHYSRFSPSPLSIKQFLEFGMKSANEKKSFEFLRQELPVRICNMMKEMNLLPENLLKMPSVKLVNSWYLQTLQDLLEFEVAVNNSKTRERFTESLTTIRNRHANVVETMAQGVLEMREGRLNVDTHEECNIQYFLDRFLMSRISIRMLINQHTLVFGTNPNGHSSRHIGSIDPNCHVVSVTHDAYDSARYLCDQYYLASPELEITTQNGSDHTSDINMVYVPSHLYHILFEIFKNAMRAVMEHHGVAAEEFPTIKVMVTKGKEDVTIKVSDQGGGIPRSVTDVMFNYLYTTAPSPPKPGTTTIPPLAGYGFGLPISRLYAKYFQGDLQICSMDGYGTDVNIYLKKLSSEANELLPVFNSSTSRHYKMPAVTHDWSRAGNNVRPYHSIYRSMSR